MEMAIVKMNKFTLLTFDACKSKLLKQLQIFEGVHFKDLQGSNVEELDFLKNDSSRESVAQYESEISKIKFVQEKIKPFVDKPTGLKAYTQAPKTLTFEEFDTFTQSYDYKSTYEAVKKLDEQLKQIRVERNKIKTDNENLQNWLNLDTSTKELDQFKNITYFLGTITKLDPFQFRESIESNFKACYVEIIGTIKDETTVMILVPMEQTEEAVVFLKNSGFSKASLNLATVPNEQIASNEKRLIELEAEEKHINSKTSQFASEDLQLAIALDYYKTVLERAKACENFLTLEEVVIIEGWVPQESFQSLEQIIAKCCGQDYYMEKEEVEKDSEEVPIKLKNNKLVSAFEGITSMYSLPKYNELDPTPLLTPFYIFFFGLMIGDIGYGIILLIVSLIATKALHLGEGTKNFMKFLFYLSFAVIGAGILNGGMFGITVFAPIKTTLNETGMKPILDSQLDIVQMIIYSIIVGIFHVLFGVAVKGYLLIREGKIADAIFDSLFWILCVLSGIGFLVGLAGIISPSMTKICEWTFYAMLIALTLTQGRENKSVGTKLAGGLFGVYGITGYVGDIVSYTRLVALALSGAYIAMSFNTMANLMPNGIIKVVAGSLIFVFGQTLNLGLAVLGAYVHTCRLQYVEFFGKFYEGGGKPFKAFKLMNESINIK